MNKWCGNIGFAFSRETSPGVWEDEITVRKYYGDVLRLSRGLQAGSDVVDDVMVSNEISILADPFANENMYAIRYVEFMGAEWRVSNISVQYPRLLLTIGGVWNGQ